MDAEMLLWGIDMMKDATVDPAKVLKWAEEPVELKTLYAAREILDRLIKEKEKPAEKGKVVPFKA